MAHSKIIIGVQTHPADLQNGRIDAARETWMSEWRHLAKSLFFFDNTHKDPKPDEIILDAPNGMLWMPWKTRAAAIWALEHGYDYMFYVPTDCYVCVPRLLVSGFESCDYTGYHAYDEPHIGGGSGYWLSTRGLRAVAGYGPHADYEDRWVGSACRANGIEAVHDPRYWSHEQPELLGIITAHLSDNTTYPATYEPTFMRAYHKQYMERGEIWRIPPVQEC
jgi:hypothetical protein